MATANSRLGRERWRGASLAERHAAFKAVYLAHPQSVRIIKNLDVRLRMQELSDDSTGIVVRCPSDGGKSAFIRYLRRRYPPVEKEDRTFYPIIGFNVPSPCNALRIANAILEEFHDPDAEGMNAGHQISRARRLFGEAKAKIIAIDNFQDVPERRGAKGVQIVGNALRDVIDCNVIAVLLGTDEGDIVVRSNEQLRRRSPASLPLGYYDVMTKEGLAICLRLVDLFDEACPLAVKSGIAATWIGKAIVYGSNGKVGAMSRLFSYAMTACVDAGLEQLRLEHFQYAFNEYYAGFEHANPFIEAPRQWRRLDQPGEPFFLVKA